CRSRSAWCADIVPQVRCFGVLELDELNLFMIASPLWRRPFDRRRRHELCLLDTRSGWVLEGVSEQRGDVVGPGARGTRDPRRSSWYVAMSSPSIRKLVSWQNGLWTIYGVAAARLQAGSNSAHGRGMARALKQSLRSRSRRLQPRRSAEH